MKEDKTLFKHLYTILFVLNCNYKGRFMETNLILEGFKFMALGMGTVFLFLITLIVLMNLMSTVLHKFFPEPSAANLESQTPNQKDNKKIIAAISAAISHHRQG